jgi:hypothetical protein
MWLTHKRSGVSPKSRCVREWLNDKITGSVRRLFFSGTNDFFSHPIRFLIWIIHNIILSFWLKRVGGRRLPKMNRHSWSYSGGIAAALCCILKQNEFLICHASFRAAFSRIT